MIVIWKIEKNTSAPWWEDYEQGRGSSGFVAHSQQMCGHAGGAGGCLSGSPSEKVGAFFSTFTSAISDYVGTCRFSWCRKALKWKLIWASWQDESSSGEIRTLLRCCQYCFETCQEQQGWSILLNQPKKEKEIINESTAAQTNPLQCAKVVVADF